MSFERAVHIVRGTQVIDADSAIGEFSENQEHLTSLELTGSARIETPNPKPGELKLMSGDVINLMYYENSDVLQSATVTAGPRCGSLRRRVLQRVCCMPTTSK